jgi:rhodanese-related sulfurtransferase
MRLECLFLELKMTIREQLYERAGRRRTELGLPYAGALTPDEAFELLRADPEVHLVDVRTRAELDWVGRPAVPAEQYAHVEWSRYPGAVPNEEFVTQLRAVARPDAPVLFLCRSAARSKLAAVAATEAGYKLAFDLLEGFEGDKDANGHRKTVGGWCYRGLPWTGA